MTGRSNFRRETIILPCQCTTGGWRDGVIQFRPHKHGISGCTGMPVAATRWVSEWEMGDD